jgi:hypothetical protein
LNLIMSSSRCGRTCPQGPHERGALSQASEIAVRTERPRHLRSKPLVTSDEKDFSSGTCPIRERRSPIARNYTVASWSWQPIPLHAGGIFPHLASALTRELWRRHGQYCSSLGKTR